MSAFSVSQTMLRPTSRQCREVFMWQRFMVNQPRRPHLIALEEPPQETFSAILERHGDSPEVRNDRQALDVYKQNMEDKAWHRHTIYKQKEFDFPDGYTGCKEIGRCYANSHLPCFPSKILNTLYKDTHRYLDAINCFPTIIKNAFSHLDLPAITEYVTNRDEVFQGMYREMRLRPDEVKMAFVKAMGASPKKHHDYGLDGADDKIRYISEHPWMLDCEKEFIMIAMDIKMRYPHFYAGIMETSRMEGRMEHSYGRLLHYFLADIEAEIMRTVIEAVFADDQDPMNFIWKFDGVLLPKVLTHDQDDIIQKCQLAVFEKIGMHMRFAFKDIDQESFSDCSSSYIVDPYKKWKRKFEMTYCKFRVPDQFGMRTPTGQIVFLSASAFMHNTAEESKEFMSRWREDPEKRLYHGVDFAPSPLVVKDGYMNTYRGMKAEKNEMDMSHDEMESRIDPYKKHVYYLMGENEQYEDYMHKLMAFKIQFPGLRWNVVPWIRSLQGTGKDQWMKFIASIVGEEYCLTVTSLKEIVGNKTGIMENKFFICVSESSYKDFKDYGEEIKHLVTKDDFVVQRKYVPEYQQRFLANIIMFSNQFNGLDINTSDRRFFPVTASGLYANDPVYHEPFNRYIQDPKNQVAVYRWLKSMDIEGFNPMGERPITTTHQELASRNCNVLALFLNKHLDDWIEWGQGTPSNVDFRTRDICLRVSTKCFWDAFEIYCQESKFNGCDTRKKTEAFGSTLLAAAVTAMRKFSTENTPSISSVKSHGKLFKLFHLPAVRSWIDYEIGEIEDDNEKDVGATVPGFVSNTK